MSLLTRQPDLIGRCTALVVDEVQCLSDESRGAELETLLTQVLLSDPKPQVVALSASLDDVNQLDTWLGATLVISSERPIPLRQMVCSIDGSAMTVDGSRPLTTPAPVPRQVDHEALAVALAKRYVDDGKQVIVFRSTIPWVAKVARTLGASLAASGMSTEVSQRFNELEDSPALKDLSRFLACGVGFHTADLTQAERSLVEYAFRTGAARVVVAT